MQDTNYSETSPKDTGLKILIVNRGTPFAYVLCFSLEIVSVAIR